MWQRHRHPAWILCQLLAVSACLAASDVRAAPCAQMDSIGLGQSYNNNYSDISLGHAAGQTFLATETEIAAITVWRDCICATDPTPWHIYIMGLDSLGTPDPSLMIQDGPILVHTDGDSATTTTPFRFVFAPPVILPAPGEYEFAVMLENCPFGPSSLSLDYGDGTDYPQGMHWDHRRQVYTCGPPRSDPIPHPESDLIFTIEFCRTETPVRPTTWGQIKALYR
jgi:hypothetical protein